jgi:hypothetical protein
VRDTPDTAVLVLFAGGEMAAMPGVEYLQRAPGGHSADADQEPDPQPLVSAEG